MPRNSDSAHSTILRAPLEAFGSFKADAINDEDVESYTIRRRGGAYGTKPVKNGTIRREITALQAALNWGRQKLMFERGMTYRFTKPEDRAARDIWINEEQERDIYKLMRQASPSVRLFFRLGMTYGQRKTAILELNFNEQVNFITNRIDFNVPGRRITRKKRSLVPMTPEVRSEMEDMFHRRNGKGRVLDASTHHDYQKFMKLIGYEWVTAHVLKHSAITLMLRAKQTMEDVSVLTSTDLKTIMKHYRHHTDDELTSVAGSRRS